MSLPKISYTQNWNGKLFCNVFSTIRLRNDSKYQVGREYDITLKGHNGGSVIICFIQHFPTIEAIPEVVWLMDTGYSKADSVDMMKTMYKNIVTNWETQQFSFILQRRVQVDKSQSEKPKKLSYKAKKAA